jgi:hypothetical protein
MFDLVFMRLTLHPKQTSPLSKEGEDIIHLMRDTNQTIMWLISKGFGNYEWNRRIKQIIAKEEKSTIFLVHAENFEVSTTIDSQHRTQKHMPYTFKIPISNMFPHVLIREI